MKKFYSHLLFAILITTLVSAQQLANHVVVIGMDGTSPFGLLSAEIPNMKMMMDNGVVTFHGRAVRPSSSSSNWGSMLMGAEPSQHGITSNGWERTNYLIEPSVVGPDGIFPTIFSVLKEAKPNLKTASVYDWDGFGRLYDKKAVDIDIHAEGSRNTIVEVEKVIVKDKPNFLFIHFDDPDAAGHSIGHYTQHYYNSITRMDTLVGRIIAATKKAGIYDETIFCIVSDHGGIGKGHGGDTMSEMEIPYIIFGKGVQKGKELTGTYYQFDNAATVAHIFDVETPQAWTGRPAAAAFESSPAKVKEKYSKDLQYPVIISTMSGVYGEPISVELKTQDKVDIFFTLDGSEPTMSSTKYTKPLTVSKSSILKARTFKSNKPGMVSTANYTIVSKENGVYYKYYEGGKWKKIPDFSTLKAVREGMIFSFDLDAITDKADDQYAIVFESFLEVAVAEDVTFYTVSDDGSKLYLNDKLVVDNDGSHGATEKSGTIQVTPGRHKLRVEYFEDYSDEALKVLYSSSSIEKMQIPLDKLFKSAK